MVENNTLSNPNIGSAIIIVGPNEFQNSLLADALDSRVNAEIVNSVSSSLHPIASSCNSGKSIVLFDCFNQTMENLYSALTSKLADVLVDNVVALYNLSSQLGVEGFALTQGVKGFFYTDDSTTVFVKGIRAMLNGEIWVARNKLAECISRQGVKFREKHLYSMDKNNSAKLTNREIEILKQLRMGFTNDVIGDRLCISSHTVRTHIYNIFRKINVNNRLEASHWAGQNLDIPFQ